MLEPGQARQLRAGSELILNIHYQPNGKPAEDSSSVGFVFAKQPPKQRVRRLIADNDRIRIPAGEAAYRSEARVRLGTDATLLSVTPHMHFRGKSMEVRATLPSGETEIIGRCPAL